MYLYAHLRMSGFARKSALPRTPPKQSTLPFVPDPQSDDEPRPTMAKPSQGTASSSQTSGSKAGKAPATKPDPAIKPTDEEEATEGIAQDNDPLGNPGDLGGDPGNDPIGGGGGRGNQTPPPGPFQPRRRMTESESPIPKLNHLLKGAENFAGWHNGLKLYL